MFIKRLLSRYGIIFLFAFIGAFAFLTSQFGRFKFGTIPGDIYVVKEGITLYFPFGTSIGIALAVTVGFDIYRVFKR